MTRYVVEVSGRRFTVTLDAGMASVDGSAPVAARAESVDGTPVRIVTIGTAAHRVTARRAGERGRYVLRIDGHRHDVDALDERTRAIRDMASASRAHAGPVALLAPMPGLVVRVHVAAGDTVAAGAPLVSIEAMKMENELRAGSAGTVRRVVAVVGQAVEKGAMLVELDASSVDR